jgi:hypothetical protein
MSLITGNKVKKHKSQGIVKKKRTKSTKEFWEVLSFDNNGLVEPSCRTVALYCPFGFFLSYGDYPWIILAEFCKLKYSIKKWGEGGDPVNLILFINFEICKLYDMSYS